MSDVLANFSCLDELTQVIYQSIFKFVVLSTVTNDKWSIYIGLSGSAGRWWRGFWTEQDIHRVFGSKSSDHLLEQFAEKLAEVFVRGEMCITNWSEEKDAQIKFTLDPTSKKPIHIPLFEMSSEDAAAHATSVFLDIALQAQSRRCRLHPSSTDYLTVSNSSFQGSHVAGPSKDKGQLEIVKETNPSLLRNNTKPATAEAKAAQEEIQSLKSQLQSAKRTGPAEKPAVVAPVAHKGASLANPNKKARKYQAIEFDSDDD